MIFGNPRKFAIQIEAIPDWSGSNSCEGLFCLYLNSYRLSAARVRSENINIATLQLLHGLENPNSNVRKPVPLPNSFIDTNDKATLGFLYNLTYPIDATDMSAVNCWDYVISPDALSDTGFELFIYTKEAGEVLVGGSISEGIAMSVLIPLGTTLSIAKQAYEHAKNLSGITI